MAFPDTSPFGFLSYWYSSTQASGDNNAGSNDIVVNHVAAALRVTLKNNDGSSVLERWSGSVLPLDGGWHNVMISWDTQAGTIQANLNGAALGLSDINTASTGGGFDITYGSNPDINVGGDPDIPDFYIGSLAELFFLAGTLIDITNPVVQAKFIQQAVIAIA